MAKETLTEKMVKDLDRYFGRLQYSVESVYRTEYDVRARVQTEERKRADGVPYFAIWSHSGNVSVFSNEWFEELVEPHWQRYLKHGRRRHDFRRIRNYLEIGVCEGRSMIWVLENLKPKTCVGLDPYIPGRVAQTDLFNEYQQRVKKNLAPWSDRVTLHKVRSDEWLRGCGPADNPGPPPDRSYDMIYVDGDHRGQFAMTDLVNCWWKLRIGGVMVLDDFNRRWAHSKPATWEAGTGFVLAFDHLFDWLYRTKKQLAIIKRKHG